MNQPKGIPMTQFCKPKLFVEAIAHRRLSALKLFLIVSTSLVTMLTMTSGCAYSYVDQHGVHHSIGLLKMSVGVDPENDTTAGTTVEVTTLGITGYRTPLLSGFSIGYNRELVMSLKNDVVVIPR